VRIEALNYYLPVELIAQQPADVRSDSRLLIFNRCGGDVVDSRFSRVGDFLTAGDCLVLNDTKVLAARFFGQRASGGKIEGLFLAEGEGSIWTVMLKGGRRVKAGEGIYLKDKEKRDFCRAVVLQKDKGICRLKIEIDADAEPILERIGFAPLPPYIKRGDDLGEAVIDSRRYQTVYARHPGAVAAPTAGLHFTEGLIEQLKTGGVDFAYITLHAGPGTFKPIRVDNVEDHKIHSEWFSVGEESARIINTAKAKGRRIIAVGTTSVRALETAAVGSGVQPASGETGLFIRPGYKFRITDAMITNFHLPRTSLLALVAAFGGVEKTIAAYRYAIEKRYRFYSYGDAMLII
jgi:S-adenosylmethionine:tRNA ribosyltransferase-isomerase